MKADIDEYIIPFLTCKCNMAMRKKRYGMLISLKTPEGPWRSIAIDFITSLLMSHRFTYVEGIIDKSPEKTHFVLIPTNADSSVC